MFMFPAFQFPQGQPHPQSGFSPQQGFSNQSPQIPFNPMQFNPQFMQQFQQGFNGFPANQNYATRAAPNFYENLVHKINPAELKSIVSEVKNGVVNDISSRAEWDSRNADGLKQMGLYTNHKGTDNTAAGGIFSSAFMQSLLTFLAQVSSIILPARGPAHMKFMNQIKDKEYLKFISERSITVEGFINNLLTDYSPEFYM